MKAFLVFSFVFISLFSYAQEIEWQNTIGGSSRDYFQSIYPTSDGGFICAGRSQSGVSGDKTEPSLGQADYWIIKLDSLGVIQWQNTIGGNKQDFLFKVKQTSDGGYICAGSSNSDITGDKTEVCRGSDDYWIVKLDASGGIVWQKTVGGDDLDYLYDIIQLQNGNYVCAGTSFSGATGDKSSASIGSYDYWLVMIDSTGNFTGEWSLGGWSPDQLHCIEPTSDGGYILGGYSSSGITGTKTVATKGGDDYWVIKYDANGLEEWQKDYGGSAYDYLYSVKETPDHGFILAGVSMSLASGDKSENSANWDNWIVRIDSVGNIVWEKTIGGLGSDWTESVAVIPEGGFFCGGYSESGLSLDKTETSMGLRDCWVYKLDDNGNIIWQNTIGGDTTEQVNSVLALGDNDYLVGAYSASGISGDKTESLVGAHDYWILKLTENYNHITGKIYIDDNSNGVQDMGEVPFAGKRISETVGRFTFAKNNGDYDLMVLDTGNIILAPDPVNYYVSAPVNHTVAFAGFHETDSINDFAIQATATAVNDVSVMIAPATRFRSGRNSYYAITYFNNGTTIQSPQIIFYPDNYADYVGADLAPVSVSADSIIWSIPLLEPLHSGTILVAVMPNIALPTGFDLTSSVVIEPILNDVTPTDNYDTWTLDVTNPFDPNDMTVSDTNLTLAQVAAGTYLDYVIRFQNTGNDTAFTVKILNPIDTNLVDINSLQLITSSHPVNMNWINYARNIEFMFDNIQLPDSIVDEEGSHGFVHFRIKARTNLSIGDSILTYAGIYFDFNAPVITNSVVTYIALPVGLGEQIDANKKLLVYPNPSADEITIGNTIINSTLELRDALGQMIQSMTVSGVQTKLNIASLQQGIYFLTMKNDIGNWMAKVIKQ